MIEPGANNNKFYNCSELGNGKFEIHFGRVGTDGRKIQDDMSNWDSTIRSKLRKGYSDVTANSTVTRIGSANGDDMGIIKPNVKKLLELLHKYAKEAFAINYTVEVSDVSELLVEQAQEIIDKINSKLKLNADVPEINALLISLYKKIPRKIKNVQESLIPPILDKTILDKANDKMLIEQGLIDVVKSQLVKPDATALDPAIKQSKALTYLDKMGLDIDEITPAEETMLKDLMTDSHQKFIAAFKVTNFKTQKAFDTDIAKSKNKKTKLLFHGSRSENWLGILKSGLILRPNAHTTGALFDRGIYFADIADKSLGYIGGGRWNGSSRDNDNWLAVYEVHTGKQCDYSDVKKLSPDSKPDLAKLVPDNGFDSYYADRKIEKRYNLQRDEFIIYSEEKCTIKYLIHL